jgi:non-homologous end joining protein Ku
MSSPRTMFSGSIKLGLLNIPITIGKATEDGREHGLSQVCDHSEQAGEIVKLDKSERCERCQGRPQHKAMAVKLPDSDEYRIFDTNELAAIEDATKSPVLKILDAQPLSKLPLLYSTGVYYVRHNTKSKSDAEAFATLAVTLSKNRMGLVCKWGSSAKEKLCVITSDRGVMMLRIIPFVDSVRPASSVEREHFTVKVAPKAVTKMDAFLQEISNPEGFAYGNYSDQGLALRAAAVERILAGEKPAQPAPAKPEVEPMDLDAMIDAAMDQVRKEKVDVSV